MSGGSCGSFDNWSRSIRSLFRKILWILIPFSPRQSERVWLLSLSKRAVIPRTRRSSKLFSSWQWLPLCILAVWNVLWCGATIMVLMFTVHRKYHGDKFANSIEAYSRKWTLRLLSSTSIAGHQFQLPPFRDDGGPWSTGKVAGLYCSWKQFALEFDRKACWHGDLFLATYFTLCPFNSKNLLMNVDVFGWMANS